MKNSIFLLLVVISTKLFGFTFDPSSLKVNQKSTTKEGTELPITVKRSHLRGVPVFPNDSTWQIVSRFTECALHLHEEGPIPPLLRGYEHQDFIKMVLKYRDSVFIFSEKRKRATGALFPFLETGDSVATTTVAFVSPVGLNPVTNPSVFEKNTRQMWLRIGFFILFGIFSAILSVKYSSKLVSLIPLVFLAVVAPIGIFSGSLHVFGFEQGVAYAGAFLMWYMVGYLPGVFIIPVFYSKRVEIA